MQKNAQEGRAKAMMMMMMMMMMMTITAAVSGLLLLPSPASQQERFKDCGYSSGSVAATCSICGRSNRRVALLVGISTFT